MTTRTTTLLGMLLLLACEDSGQESSGEECDAMIDSPDVDFDEENCKAVGLIVGCLEAAGVEADALSDEELRVEVDACAMQFKFCWLDPSLAGIPEGTTVSELRGETNMCVG